MPSEQPATGFPGYVVYYRGLEHHHGPGVGALVEVHLSPWVSNNERDMERRYGRTMREKTYQIFSKPRDQTGTLFGKMVPTNRVKCLTTLSTCSSDRRPWYHWRCRDLETHAMGVRFPLAGMHEERPPRPNGLLSTILAPPFNLELVHGSNGFGECLTHR